MSRILSLATAITSVALLASASLAQAIPKKLDRWLEIRSEHFTIYSNAGERATEGVASDLELLHKVVSELSGRSPNVPLPTLVHIFRNDRDFTPYKFLYEGKAGSLSGFFMGREHANFIALDASSPIGASEIIYHEYIHYYLHSNYPALPLWLDEGLAEFYSSFDTDREFANIGKPVSRHILWLRHEPLIPLAELLAIDRSSPTYNEGTRKGSFYAQSWALVHYLLVGNRERRPHAERFLELLARNVPQDEAFRTAFQADYATLETELRSYVRRLTFPYSRLPLEDRSVAVGPARSLGAHEALSRLGDLLLYQEGRSHEAAEHFRAALEAVPDYSPALASLAYAAELEERHGDARELYRRAAASEGASVATLFRAAQHLLQTGGEDAAEALPFVQRCVKIAPEFGPCWVLRAYAHTFEDKPSEDALKAAWQAHRMFPDRVDVAHNLLVLAARRQERSTVQTLVDDYFASLPEAEPRRRAEEILVQLDVQRAFDRLNGGGLDDAEAILAELELRAANAPGMDMAEAIGQLREAIASERSIERYNRVIALANAGDLERAIALLEEHLAATPEGVTAPESRDLLQELRTLQQDKARAAARDAAPAPRPRPSRTAPPAGPGPLQKLMKEVNSLTIRGRLEEALRLLERSRDAPEHRDDRMWIDHQIDQVGKNLAYNRFVERYNEAVDLVNAKEYGRAVALLEQLVHEAPNENEARDTRELLERTRAKMR